MSVFINPLVEIVKILLVPVSRHIGYLVKSKVKVCDLEVETCRLEDKRADFMAGVEVEKINGKVLTKEANGWFQRAQDLELQADQVVARYNDRKCCFGGLCPNCPSNYKLGRRAAKKRIRVTANIDVADSVQWTMAAPPSLGREMPARTITAWELGNSIKYYGSLYLAKIQNSIARQIGLELNVEDEETVAEILFVSLNRQRFMLILDDMWDLLDIDRIRVPRPNAQNRCKIIITTRQLAICNLMETDKITKLDVLQKGDAWNLFHQKAGEVVDLPNIEPCAREIVRECSGLPLAIITVGCAMKGKSSVQVWENASRALREASPEIEGMERQVFSSLKYSYERLEGENIKSCFLYCSLFPEDYEIEKDELVQYWICEGLTGRVDSPKYARNKGHDRIEKL
ncbi:probable disease resistance protein At5g43730 [Amborella trichopoda]|uniref:probable disease resistance protein At5g43730 n=1 Tax=Amborella trichopoda TaxID=13333 RepID=UPI0009BD9B49|nr:probable disease resistance protein At5g43730 [Amborella trichopoda]|eukprot:XP_020531543.1 probable disease resistance protein At5g43730 [Amborella trichopoda]